MTVQLIPILSIFIWLCISCESSQFIGNAKTKNKAPSSSAEEVVLGSTDETETMTDLENIPEDPEKICYETAKPLPDTMTKPKLLFNWKSSGEFADYKQVLSTVTVGKIFDEAPSLVVAAIKMVDAYIGDSMLFAISGKNGDLQWIAKDKEGSYLTQLAWMASAAIGDIDGDGKSEVVIANLEGIVFALDGKTGLEKWRSQELSAVGDDDFGGAALADLDNDGKIEVIASGKVLYGMDGLLKFSYQGQRIKQTVVGDVQPEHSGVEIVSGDGIFDGRSGDKICAFDPLINMVGFGKLSANATSYLIVGRTSSDNWTNEVVGFDSVSCVRLFKIDFPGGGGGAFNFADFDGDGVLEFGSAGKAHYVVFKFDSVAGEVKILWQQDTEDDSSSITGSTTFDFNGDGKAEIVYRDEHNLRVYEGETGRIVYEIAVPNGTRVEYPVIADANADGLAEIIVGVDNHAWGEGNGVMVFGAPNDDWVGTRPIWNQYAYYVTNVSDDGKVVGFDAKRIYSKYKYISSEHLLGFRNNIPIRPTKSCDE